MVNIENFTKRLQTIMEFHDLSAASFADKIDVGRSSISHLLSGRNKPSLDFVMKIVQSFPEVELYWLLNGKGSFPKKENNTTSAKPETAPQDLFSGINEPGAAKNLSAEGKRKEIDKIVIFYTDGSFEAFKN